MSYAGELFANAFSRSFEGAAERKAKKEALVTQHANRLAEIEKTESIRLDREARDRKKIVDSRIEALGKYIEDPTMRETIAANDVVFTQTWNTLTKEPKKKTVYFVNEKGEQETRRIEVEKEPEFMQEMNARGIPEYKTESPLGSDTINLTNRKTDIQQGADGLRNAPGNTNTGQDAAAYQEAVKQAAAILKIPENSIPPNMREALQNPNTRAAAIAKLMEKHKPNG